MQRPPDDLHIASLSSLVLIIPVRAGGWAGNAQGIMLADVGSVLRRAPEIFK